MGKKNTTGDDSNEGRGLLCETNVWFKLDSECVAIIYQCGTEFIESRLRRGMCEVKLMGQTSPSIKPDRL